LLGPFYARAADLNFSWEFVVSLGIADISWMIFAVLLLRLGFMMCFRHYSVVIDGEARTVESVHRIGPFRRAKRFQMQDLSSVLLVSRTERFDEELEDHGVTRVYQLKILTKSGKPRWILVRNTESVEEARALGKKISQMLGMSLKDKTLPKRTPEPAVLTPGTIFMSRLEFRDMSHSFYLLSERKDEDTLLLRRISDVEVSGPDEAGVDGWTRPVIPAEPLTDELAEEIVVRRNGAKFVDEAGRFYGPWDGCDQPYRCV